MHIYGVTTLFLTLGLVCLTSAAQDTNPQHGTEAANTAASQKMSDQHFVREAADGGMAEVELGQLAVDKASNPQVKEFAQRMVADHSKANDQLKQIAANKGIELPAEPSPKCKATKDRLSKLSGEQFDKAYMSDMLMDHKKDVAAFKSESANGQDPDIKQFAAQTLPTLEDHLQQAQTVAPKVSHPAE